MIRDIASLDLDHYAHSVTMTFKVNGKAQYKLDIRIEGMYEQYHRGFCQLHKLYV